MLLKRFFEQKNNNNNIYINARKILIINNYPLNKLDKYNNLTLLLYPINIINTISFIFLYHFEIFFW